MLLSSLPHDIHDIIATLLQPYEIFSLSMAAHAFLYLRQQDSEYFVIEAINNNNFDLALMFIKFNFKYSLSDIFDKYVLTTAIVREIVRQNYHNPKIERRINRYAITNRDYDLINWLHKCNKLIAPYVYDDYYYRAPVDILSIYLQYTTFPVGIIKIGFPSEIESMSICGYVFGDEHYTSAITMSLGLFEWMCDNLCAKSALIAAIKTKNMRVIKYAMNAYLDISDELGEINYEVFDAFD